MRDSKNRSAPRILGFRYPILFLIFLGLSLESLSALPKYAFRSARLCDNCHTTPFKNPFQEEWKNPELAARKCNMSCQSCHVNPAGGGIRNAPGRFYAASTLGSWGAKFRPYNDRIRREPGQIGRRTYDALWNFFNKKNSPANKPASDDEPIRAGNGSGPADSTEPAPEKPSPGPKTGEKPEAAGGNAPPNGINSGSGGDTALPDNQRAWPRELEVWYQNPEKFEPRWYYPDDWLSYGHPLDAGRVADQSEYAFDRDRYASFNADPFFTVGADVRPAFYSSDGYSTVFPMQTELGGALHPVEHITLSATGALQGRTTGVEDSLNAPENNPVRLQQAFVLIHELPYQAYVQAGSFLPEFGLRGEDHTLPGRRYFDMDPGQADNFYPGVQIGAAPNYPYISAGLFRTEAAESITPLDGSASNETGWGGTLNLAWRDIPWGAGLSGLYKDHTGGALKYDRERVGPLKAISLNGYYNLWHLWPSNRYTFPIILQAEFNLGQTRRALLDGEKMFHTWFFQADWLALNGVNLKFNHAFGDTDHNLAGDSFHRWGLGLDWTILPGARLSPEFRLLLPEDGGPSSEFLVFLHGYL